MAAPRRRIIRPPKRGPSAWWLAALLAAILGAACYVKPALFAPASAPEKSSGSEHRFDPLEAMRNREKGQPHRNGLAHPPRSGEPAGDESEPAMQPAPTAGNAGAWRSAPDFVSPPGPGYRSPSTLANPVYGPGTQPRPGPAPGGPSTLHRTTSRTASNGSSGSSGLPGPASSRDGRLHTDSLIPGLENPLPSASPVAGYGRPANIGGAPKGYETP